MTAEGLYGYQPSVFEKEIWNRLKTGLLVDLKTMDIPSEFESVIYRLTESRVGSHKCGYSVSDGYFYISVGDKGKISLSCNSHDIEDMRWFILEKTAREAGQRLELLQREDDKKNWRYLKNWDGNGKRADIEQTGYIYNTVDDTRKFWIEYEIRALSRIFPESRMKPFIEYNIRCMNYWFEIPHWGFDYERLCFVEISDSREKE